MDNQDKEFEAFLRQFQLRQHGPLREMTPEPIRRSRPMWGLVAAAAVVVVLLSATLARNLVRSVAPGPMVEAAGDSEYRVGDRVAAGSPVRAGSADSLALSLDDGSRLELRARSEAEFESAADGTRVMLNSGAVIVNAAKQRAGHLYVETPNAVATVVGTVFVVETEPVGTRVAVLEGEVEVRYEGKSEIVAAGGQVVTEQSMEERALAEMIAWSRYMTELARLLPEGGHPSPFHESPRVAPAPSPLFHPETSSSSPSPQQPAPQPQPSPSPERNQPDSGAEGLGKQIFERACGQCHSLKDASIVYASPDQYAVLVSRERSKGASIADAEVQPLIDYLFKTFGAKVKP